MKKTLFIKNAAILTASSLILRFAGIIFKVWLAALIGSEGIGLYQLVFSVYVLSATFASSGISTAVTRLTAEELALGGKKGTMKILRRSLELTLIIALLSVCLVFFGADFIAKSLLGDVRAVIALKILPFSLPFMGVSSCIRGYFIARRKATPGAAAQLAEQAVRISVVVALVKAFKGKGLAVCCGAVLAGDVISETLSCIMLITMLLSDSKRLYNSGRKHPPYKILKKLLGIAVPITSGRYLNTALRTVENLLVPKSLAKYPLSGKNALSQFGMIKGMALPILFFPSALLNSVSTLLIPEMSEAAAKRQNRLVSSATQKILKLTAVISFIFAAIFFTSGEEIGLLIYRERDVGILIKSLSPIVPLMYLDSISDGILKGLDQQVFSFRTSVSDSVIRIGMIILLLPSTGLKGFIGIMYISNLLTCILNVGRLIKISHADFKITEELIIPLLCATVIALLTDTLLSFLPITSILVYIILICIISVPLYFAVLFLLGILKRDEIMHIIK